MLTPTAPTTRQIYLITSAAYDGWVFIGLSYRPEDKIRDFQQYNPVDSFNLIFQNGSSLQQFRRFKKLFSLRSKNIKGNWFEIPLKDAQDILSNKIADGYKPTPAYQ